MATGGKPAAAVPPPATPSSSTHALESVHFSSGNPRIEETRGVVLLHPDPPAAAYSSGLPVGRKPQVCVLAVPNHMTYADFCRFCGAFVPHTLEMRIVRIDGVEDQYSVLIKFDTQISTDSFYKHFNGKQFSSLEGGLCCVRFVEDVHYTQLIEHAHSSVTSSAEQPTCPVCLASEANDVYLLEILPIFDAANLFGWLPNFGTPNVGAPLSLRLLFVSPPQLWLDRLFPLDTPTLYICQVLPKVWRTNGKEKDLTKILEAFLLQFAITLFTALAYRNGQTPHAQFVCRYCQQQPEKSMCSICGTSENLWICVICGYVGCGRYKGGHAIEHWKETQHCYSLELETQKVWDYAGDNYVHRLIQSKTDGKLVEYNCHGDHTADSSCLLCSGDAGMNEALLNSKVEAIVEEYNELLTSQLEKQRNYYESLLLEVKEETEQEISAATEKALSTKQQKLQAKLDKCREEKRFLDDMNNNLVKNLEMWREKIQKRQAREQAAIRLKDEKIEKLQEELRDLMALLGCQDAVAQGPDSISSDIQGGTILPVESESSSSSSSSPVGGTRNGKRE
ncbi:hypothetical protein ACP70R_028824 [Stipagrostis hirtigluma subsp. patula]